MRRNEWLGGCALQDILRINHITVCSTRLVIIKFYSFSRAHQAVQTIPFTAFEMLHVSRIAFTMGLSFQQMNSHRKGCTQRKNPWLVERGKGEVGNV